MLVRLTTVRRLPQTLGVRLFSSIRPEGSVAQSKEFSKKERAHEDQFIRQHEQEQLRKLKADVLDLLPPLSNVILTSYLPRSTRKRLNSCVCLSLTSNSNISPF
ncbi:hypothetical protein Ac2012v2_006058 [Leucoagaricus gongylophorus]